MTGGGGPAVGFALEEAVSRAFEQAGWRVDRAPALGSIHPDLIAISPDGRVVLAEVKAMTTPVSVTSIAQIAAYRRAAEEVPDYQGVEVVLFSLGPVSERARKAADEMEIAVVTPDRSRHDWRSHLKSVAIDQIARDMIAAFEGHERSQPVRVGDPALLAALPEPSLRHLARTYRLSEAFVDVSRRVAYFELLRAASDALSRLLNHEPAPGLLRDVAAPALAHDEAFLDYLYSHVDRHVMTSPEIFTQLVQAAAGVLVAEYMHETHAVDD